MAVNIHFFILALPWLILLPAVKLASLSSQYFLYVFLFDIWLLSHPHVIATFFKHDLSSKLSLKFLPIIFIALTLLLGSISWNFGQVVLFNVYFYTQWFHYMRQNYGIAIKNHPRTTVFEYRFQKILLHLVPVTALLNLNSKSSLSFFGYYLFFPEFSVKLNPYIEMIFISLFFLFAIGEVVKHRKGVFNQTYFLYFISNYLIYAWAYFLQDNFMYGWLGLTFYHNIQYLVFSWRNNFLENQRKNFYLFYGITTLISLLIFGFIEYGGKLIYSYAISLVFVGTLGVNFTHYLYDAIIWRKKSPTSVGP